ncbi:MAG: hypothetical protein HY829_04695 [Actinobacteria bacterium]|nr:hypothetical protein [Actinomycetota bacterium]
MARPRRHTLYATLLAALMLGACTSTRSPVPATSPPASPAQLASASSTSPEDQAKVLAKATIEKYWATYTQCLEDPNAQPTCFDDVAIAIELQKLQNTLSGARQVGSKASGAINVVSMDLVTVDLTNRVNETPPTVPYVVYRVCLDVSQFQVVDKDGKSLIPQTRKPRASASMSVANYKLPDPSQWRVDSMGTEAIAC